MTKLKTLKDLIETRVFDNGNNCDVVFPDELKAEAVKWAKFYELKGDVKSKLAIMDFSSITEEDLK